MERLEIIIKKKSEAFDPFYKSRIDPEFFQSRYLKLENILLKKDFDYLGNVAFVTDGEHGTVKTSEKGYSKYFGARNVLTGILNENGVEFITEKEHFKLKKSILNPRDLLISCVGANIGFSSIVPDNIGVANIVRNVVLIRSKSDFLNEYFLAYFLSKYGKELYYRLNSGNAQPLVSLDYINTIPVHRASNIFQIKIQEIVGKALYSGNNSKITYSKAEEILLQEIGLLDFKPNKEPVNVKSFKDSFCISGRLDAEYYQKKYEEIIEKIKSQKYDTLKQVVSIGKSIEPGSNYYSDDETGLPFMRVADYNKFGLTEPNKRLTIDFVKDHQDKIDKLKPKKGTILFSKDGSVGTAYHLREDFEGVNSSAILHLNVKKPKELLSEYLTLALNSKVVKMQAERDAGGSIILHWRIGEIENLIVPIIDFEKQKQIAVLVEESFKLKKESEQLLGVAKRSVEIAIEENEAKALKYMEENMI